MYYNGQGTPQDFPEAFKWFMQVAEQGFAHSQFKLGVMYASGRDIAQDGKEAVKWFRLSAEQGMAYEN